MLRFFFLSPIVRHRSKFPEWRMNNGDLRSVTFTRKALNQAAEKKKFISRLQILARQHNASRTGGGCVRRDVKTFHLVVIARARIVPASSILSLSDTDEKCSMFQSPQHYHTVCSTCYRMTTKC